MGEGLFCYAEKNAKMDLHKNNDEKTYTDKAVEAYKNEYKVFLNILWDYMDYWEKWSENSGKGPYVDPDKVASNGKRINPQFYLDLSMFLKANKKVN